MQNSELTDIRPAKVNYWLSLAESRGIHDPAVLNLKLKHTNGSDGFNVQDIVLKEIVRRPIDVALRIRLIQHYVEQNQVTEAFAYVYEIEIKGAANFRHSIDWYSAVSHVLDKYKESHGASLLRNWSYWLLLLWTLERRLHLSLLQTTKDNQRSKQNLTTTIALLAEFDNQLNMAATECTFPDAERDLASECLLHYRGQLCLHMAAVMFKREIENGFRANWSETTKMTLPLLMLSYNCGAANVKQEWLKNANEVSKNLIEHWHNVTCFRRIQAIRTLQSCLWSNESSDNDALANLRRICTDKHAVWFTVADLFGEMRSFVADTEWRKKIYRNLFGNKQQGSHFLRSQAFDTPVYDWPDMMVLKQYEEKSQQADPASLQHMVYVTMGSEPTKKTPITIDAEFRCELFTNMHLSVSNLSNCNSETLNKLDIETFLFAATIQAKRTISAENTLVGSSGVEFDRPKLLPFAVIADSLCTSEQSEWWSAVYKVRWLL